MEIIVNNERVVGAYLGFPVENRKDLMKNPQCKKFLEENEKYFHTTDPKMILEFFSKTGILLEHVYSKRSLAVNFLGVKVEYPYQFYPYHMYSHHIWIIDDDDCIEIRKQDLYLNGNFVRNIEEEKKEQKNRLDAFLKIKEKLQDVFEHPGYYDRFEREKENFIYNSEWFSVHESIKNTEQLVISPYGDLFTLTTEGILYWNKQIYATQVDYIFEQDSINKLIVFQNGNVEYLTASFGGPLSICCDKVLYTKNCLVTLKDKRLQIINKEYEEYVADLSHTFVLCGVSDVYFKTNDYDELVIKVGKEEITYPL